MSLFFPHFIGGLSAIALLAVRLVVGVAFVFHGAGKFQAGAFTWMGEDAAIPGLLQFIAAAIEVGGGILLAVGALTPLAVLLLGLVMAGAVMFHLGNGDPFVASGASYELALVYLALCIQFLFLGPGKLSVDYVTFGRKRAAK